MTTVDAAAWVCLLAPLAGAAVIAAGGVRIPRRTAGYLSTVTTMIAFAAAIAAFVTMLGESASSRVHATTSWTWLSAGRYHFGLTLLTDQLSVMMMLIVTGVGSLIVAYSVGYMEGEDEERRFFAYMSLFVFSMLLLVQGGNLLLLLAGWGMVGLSSYLLIGFYQEKPEAIAAAKKAFVMNAFGDATMVLALFLLIQHTGRLDYAGVFASAPHGGTIANLIALGLLGGAVAKSAQIPLHTWLPDAMEGPTPVSALIHAATMVTAGVYLIARTHPLFEYAPHVEDLAAGLGAATLLMAGLIALVQNDIKRVIAYSTMSQIGYMFVGAAVGAYPNGMFHLMTHAFFKALLFLAAGIVIHALTGEQDIRNMGGLGKAMPHTRRAFLIGSLALVGIPPFAGFFSKDSIIAATLDRGAFGYCLFAACLAGAFLTGVYTFRLFFVVFGGEQSAFAQEHLHKPHGNLEGPFSMVWTVTVLAGLSVVGGFLQFGGVWHPLTTWLDPVARPFVGASNRNEAIASVCAVVLGAAGMYVAYAMYAVKTMKVPATVTLFEKKFYWDELYDAAFYRPADILSKGLGRFVEQPVIAGSIGELTRGFRLGSGELGRVQNGLVRSYALALASGVAILAVVFLSTR
ncbi:MAG TPA: NADH-quinone oxidoreductase subunit L [Gaiellaceae bacterium]|nr:NADH-quinone oxidoreductase subunit L [Gaiellaceae bacterium]